MYDMTIYGALSLAVTIFSLYCQILKNQSSRLCNVFILNKARRCLSLCPEI